MGKLTVEGLTIVEQAKGLVHLVARLCKWNRESLGHRVSARLGAVEASWLGVQKKQETFRQPTEYPVLVFRRFPWSRECFLVAQVYDVLARQRVRRAK